MNAIEDQELASVELKERRLWTCTNFMRYAREGNELLEYITYGKKRAQWDPSTIGDLRMNEPKKGASARRRIPFVDEVQGRLYVEGFRLDKQPY